MGDLSQLDASIILPMLFVMIWAIGIHEYAHAKFADMAGDPTPRLQGRVTLNPLKHLDPIGSIMIFFTMLAGAGMGWGKPVQVNPLRMKNYRTDHWISVAAGPVSNLLQASVYGVVLRIILMTHNTEILAPPWVQNLFLFGILLNLSLFFFNLLPIGVLDGHWLVGLLLPEPARTQWFRFHQTYGVLLLIGVVIFGRELLGQILGPLLDGGFKLLTGTLPQLL